MNEPHEGPEGGERRWKAVYTIVEVPGQEKKLWLRVGIAFPNRDQSYNVRLDALPLNGTLHIRDADRDEGRGGREGGYRGGRAAVKEVA